MENALHAAQAAGSKTEGHRVELTVSGWLTIVLAIAGVSMGAYGAYQHYASAPAARSPVATLRQQAGSQLASQLGSQPGSQSASQLAPQQESAFQMNPSVASMPSVTQLTHVLVKERRDHDIQIAAWRAMAEVTRQQIASMHSSLQALDDRIDAIQKTPPPARAVRPDIAGAVSGARALHAALDTARATADVDVTSLPVETVSAQSLNVTGFGNGVVDIGDQKLTVGQVYQPGETIVAVDPVSRSIVTNRRIINVSN